MSPTSQTGNQLLPEVAVESMGRFEILLPSLISTALRNGNEILSSPLSLFGSLVPRGSSAAIRQVDVIWMGCSSLDLMDSDCKKRAACAARK